MNPKKFEEIMQKSFYTSIYTKKEARSFLNPRSFVQAKKYQYFLPCFSFIINVSVFQIFDEVFWQFWPVLKDMDVETFWLLSLL